MLSKSHFHSCDRIMVLLSQKVLDPGVRRNVREADRVEKWRSHISKQGHSLWLIHNEVTQAGGLPLD